MSVLRYNEIQLEVVRTTRYERRPVYDAGVYLYTRHTVTVQAVFNPSATSYDFVHERTLQAGVNPDPALEGGAAPTSQGARPTRGRDDANNGNLTDRAVRHLLMQKRGRLVYTAGGPESGLQPYQAFPTFRGGAQASIILDVPERTGKKPQPPNPEGAPDFGGVLVEADLLPDDPDPAGFWGGINLGYVCDCTGGPTPLSCNVWRIDGTGTFRVDYTIQADVGEHSFFFNKPPVLLSHVWGMDLDVDVDGFATRRVSGRAIFRRDVLEQQAVRPDDFRSLLVHPIPAHMKRESLRVSQAEDGNTLSYEIIDKEYSHRVSYPDVMRVEAFARIGMNRGSGEQGLGAAAGGVGKVAGAINKAKGLAKGLAGAGAAGLSTVYNLLPSAYIDAIVRVWGNNKTTLRQLRAAANRVLINRLGDVTAQQNSFTIDEGYDWAGRYVEVHWHVTLAGIMGALDLVNLDDLKFKLPDLENAQEYERVRQDSTVEANPTNDPKVNGPFGKGFVILDARLGQNQPGRGFRTLVKGGQVVGEDANKGTWLGAVQAQLFWDSASDPPEPPAGPTVQNLKTLMY